MTRLRLKLSNLHLLCLERCIPFSGRKCPICTFGDACDYDYQPTL